MEQSSLEYDYYERNYYLLKERCDFSLTMFLISSKLCEKNIYNCEFWSTRNKIIIDFFNKFDTISKERKKKIIRCYDKVLKIKSKKYNIFKYKLYDKTNFIYLERKWLDKCLKIDFKNFQVWNAFDVLVTVNYFKPKNICFLYDICILDSRNIHLWTFIQKYILRYNEYKFGLEFTENVIKMYPKNNSAWNCRFYIVKKIGIDKMVSHETNLILSSIDEKNNTALINYVFGFVNFYPIYRILKKICPRIRDPYFKYRFILYSIQNNRREFYDTCHEFMEHLELVCYQDLHHLREAIMYIKKSSIFD